MRSAALIIVTTLALAGCTRAAIHDGDMGSPPDPPADMMTPADATPPPDLASADMASADMVMPPPAPLSFSAALGSGTAFAGLWGSAGDGLFAVGNAGLLWRSTDDGAHFTASTAAGTTGLRAVWGTGRGDVWAVGDNDFVLHSSDHGASWSRQSTPATGSELLAISGSAGAIVIVGVSRMLRSVDGGATFTLDLSPMTRGVAYAALGFDHTILLAGQSGEIVRSTDDGAHFTSIAVSGLSDVHGLWRDGATTWAAATAGFARSDDGGATWTVLPMPNKNESWAAIAGRTSDLWATSNGGIAHSIDHGASFTHVLPGYVDVGLSAWTMSTGTTFLGADYGALLRVATDDQIRVLATGAMLSHASAASNGELFVVAGYAGTLIHSSDRGASWDVLPMAGADVWAAQPGELWTVAGANLDRSLDGGHTWTTIDLSSFGNGFSRIWIPKQGEIWIGGHGPLLRSTDGGASFTKIVGDASAYYGDFAGDADRVWVSYATGAMRSTDHGVTWQTPYTFTGGNPCFGAFSLGNDIWQVGAGGTIVHSSDGTTFTEQPSGVTVGLTGGWGRALDDVYVVGESGTILHSADAGAHWTALPSGTNKALNAIVSDGKGGALILGDAMLLHGQ